MSFQSSGCTQFVWSFVSDIGFGLVGCLMSQLRVSVERPSGEWKPSDFQLGPNRVTILAPPSTLPITHNSNPAATMSSKNVFPLTPCACPIRMHVSASIFLQQFASTFPVGSTASPFPLLKARTWSVRRPVNMLTRDGTHCGLFQYVFTKFTPSAAIFRK